MQQDVMKSFTTIDLYGCTDPTTHNYDPEATEDDGLCETCDDGIQNGDETGVDCGGALCVPCVSGCLVVTTTNPTGAGSLTEAINCANNNSGPDTIIFYIPGTESAYNSITFINSSSNYYG
ncbi:MAG: hypothetical protein R2771_14330 [Saprospiraceae bacterium]